MSTDSVTPTRTTSRCKVIVIGGGFAGMGLPAQLIRPINGELLWLVNEAAARYLSDITQ